MIASLIGAAVGVFTILLARVIRGQRWLYAIGLLVLPALYVMFALQAGQRAAGITEMLYGIPFVVAGLVFAFRSIRYSAVAVGVFWMLHGFFDLVHSRLFINPGVPSWYPAWCGSVDIVVGVYLLWFSRRVPDANLRRA